MSAARYFAAIALACSTVCVIPHSTLAQDGSAPVSPDVENSKYQFEGKINSSAVYIRSGPSDNDYPTMKLERDVNVTVVGMKFDWLKIAPPKDSFCYVAKAYVEKRGAGNVGRVTSPLNVRIGSGLNAMKTKIAAKLEAGQDVDIIGEQDEYFKIAPPSGVFVYVNKQFVDPVRPVTTEQPTGPVVTNDQGSTTPPVIDNGTTTTPPLIVPNDQGNGTTTPPVIADASQGQQQPTEPPTIAPPTTQSSETSVAQAGSQSGTKAGLTQAEAETEFDRLAAAYSDASHKSLDQQPLEELQAGFEKLVSAAVLPSTLQAKAESDLAIIKQRSGDKTNYVAALARQEALKQKQVALQAERKELEQIIANNTVQTYAAVGTLQLSSLQTGQETLYRLTDPRTGRTLVYIRSNDQQYAQLVGQFIGVKGQLSDDAQLNLKVIIPASAVAVDPTQVNTKIVAQIVPPSLLPQSGTAKIE